MRYITADRIFDGRSFLAEGTILVLGNRDYFYETVSGKEIANEVVERFNGVITPGFVNVHCHLELSHLKNKIQQHIGLPAFGKQVILQRNKFDSAEVAEQQKHADRAMWKAGIVAVGDISNGTDSFEQKSDSNIFYHTFIELIGLHPDNATLVFEKGVELFKKLADYQLKGSLAPHAPYSTSKQLIQKIADFDSDRDLPLSIHNQETDDEAKFFNGEKSGFHDLYQFLNLDISWFQAPKTSSLKNYVDALSNKPSVLVHNTTTALDDIAKTNSKNVYWCFCPYANKFIENRLPDFNLFKGLENKICLGTDSLASNLHLDLIEEANLMLRESNAFTPEAVLRAMTYNAAEALGISTTFGQFIKGRNTGLNLIELKNDQFRFIKKIV